MIVISSKVLWPYNHIWWQVHLYCLRKPFRLYSWNEQTKSEDYWLVGCDAMLCSPIGFSNISEERAAPIFMANSHSFTKLYGITSRSGAMKVI